MDGDKPSASNGGDGWFQQRVALVLGVAGYAKPHNLGTPLADVSLVARALTARGFRCEVVTDPCFETMAKSVADFSERAASADLALLYYAGHGFEHDGTGTVIPRDFPFPISAHGLHHFGHPVALFADALARCPGAAVLILDACRNQLDDPEERRRWAELASSLPFPSRHHNLVVCWSTSAGDRATDGSGPSSPFAIAFAELCLEHDLDINDVLSKVGNTVMRETGGVQRPWYRSSLESPFRLSDLPRYEHATSNQMPLPATGGPLWLARDHARSRLLACGRSASVWQVPEPAIRVLHSVGASASAIVADWLPEGVAVVDDAPSLTVRQGGLKRTSLRRRPHGIRTNPSGSRLVLLGTRFVELFHVGRSRLRLVRRWNLDWSPYGGAFEDARIAWLVGEDGMVARLDANSARLEPLTDANPYAGHNYDVSFLGSGNLVVVGGGGIVRIIRPLSGDPVALSDLPPNPYRPRFERTGCPALKEVVAMRHGDADFLFCDVAEDDRVVAIGTSAGTAILMDTRDGRLLQTLYQGTATGSLEGLAFASDGSLACLGRNAGLSVAIPKTLSVRMRDPIGSVHGGGGDLKSGTAGGAPP